MELIHIPLPRPPASLLVMRWQPLPKFRVWDNLCRSFLQSSALLPEPRDGGPNRPNVVESPGGDEGWPGGRVARGEEEPDGHENTLHQHDDHKAPYSRLMTSVSLVGVTILM